MQSNLKVVPPAIPDRKGGSPAPQQKGMGQGGQGQGGEEAREDELFDAECLNLINEYFYGLRIFPG